MGEEERLKKQAEDAAKKLPEGQREEYIRKYISDAFRIRDKFAQVSKANKFDDDEEDLFRQFLGSVQTVDDEGKERPEAELWTEATDKVLKIREKYTPKKEKEEETEDAPKGNREPRGAREIEIEGESAEESEEDYPLGDNDKYFEWRVKQYLKPATLKQKDLYAGN